MPQSFIRRFKGREQEVVNEIKLDGYDNFCKRERISSVGFALQIWFQKQRGCENDSIYNYFSSDSPIQDLPLVKQIVLAVQKERSNHADILAKDKARMDEMAREVEFLKEQLRYYRMAEYRDLKPLYELCCQPTRGDPV